MPASIKRKSSSNETNEAVLSPPPASRQRINDEPRPDATQSLSSTAVSPDEQQQQQSSVVLPSQEGIDAMIEALNESETVKEAEDAMEALFDLVDIHQNTLAARKDACQKIAKGQFGVGAILISLERWFVQSSELKFRSS